MGKTNKPFSMTKSIVTYVICGVLILALSVGNYYASLYKDLITVYTSGSGTVTTDESEAVCLEAEEEGMVLLKNDKGLPLSKGAKVSLFGQDSVDFVYGGSGSGSVDTKSAPTLKQAMESAGFSVNETLWDFYDTGAGKDYRKEVPDETGAGAFAVNEVPSSLYSDDVKASFADFNDAAIVCIGRSGGESADLPTQPLASGYQYLELDNNELDMLTMACENFDNVVVVLNANNPMELGFLEDEEYKNVKSCVWVGGVGQVGINAIGAALAGDINFSGHLSDTYAYDSLSAPSNANLGDYTIANSTIDRGDKYLVYAEGVYVGYRYYETRYEDTVTGQGNAGDYNYASTVQFPFGYGMSYTDFQWSDYSVEEKDDTFEVSVTVTNTGKVDGKDVVEVYMQSPYTQYDIENEIEKPSVELVGFAKTDVIKAGKSQTVTISVDKESMKAYDAKNAKTYILDAGDYYLAAGTDAHDALNNILAAKGFTTANGMDADGDAELSYKTTVDTMDTSIYSKSATTGEKVTNQLDDVDITSYDDTFQYLSRNDWTGTYPVTYGNGSWTVSDEILTALAWNRSNDVINDGSSMPTFEQKTDETVSKARDKAYDDEVWQEMIQSMTSSRAMQLVRMGGYATIQADEIGLPATQDKDGPSGISGTLVGGQSAMAYPVETVLACTWNTDLLYRLGLSVGEDSINTGVTGWYAPGANIHRSPYSGRNFEYFSEDGYLSAQMAGNEVKGCQEKRVLTYAKHFALNDQETNRYGAAIFANEQSVRELYLKGFEGAVTIGHTTGIMDAMNRVGTTWVGAHKGMVTNILRNEWGFEGVVITDQASVSAMFYQDMVSGLAAGTDLWLNTNKSFWNLSKYEEQDGTVTDWTSNATVMNNVQRAAKNVVYAVSQSNAMDNVAEDGTVVAKKAPWQIALIILDILVYGLCAILIILTTIRLVKYMRAQPKQEEEGDDIVKKSKVVVLVIIAVVLGLIVGTLGMKFLGNKATDTNKGTAGTEDTSASNVYVYGEAVTNDYDGTDYNVYQLTLKEDGTYELTMTQATYAYSMLLANTSVISNGTYTKGDSANGFTACNLTKAYRIQYNSYSDVGGYNLSYDTNTVDTYPVELPGGTMTEKEDFWSQFGPERTVYLDDAQTSVMTLSMD